VISQFKYKKAVLLNPEYFFHEVSQFLELKGFSDEEKPPDTRILGILNNLNDLSSLF
jgi:hypothetical protein